MLSKLVVQGTQNVIRACCEQKVKHLVYTSTTDVIVGFDDVVDADETTEEPAALLFPGYGHSKKHGEAAVLRANSTSGRCSQSHHHILAFVNSSFSYSK